ncbi:MAG: hypothetical protein ACRD37_13725, partial [Candidatus Acidiferrales bacterium]
MANVAQAMDSYDCAIGVRGRKQAGMFKPLRRMMRRSYLSAVCSAFLFIASCGGSPHPNTQQAEKPAAPAYPPEVDQVMQKLFG